MKKTIILCLLFFYALSAFAGMDATLTNLLLQANKYYQQGEFETAIKAYNRVLQYEPENRVALEYIGYSYLNMEKYKPALKYLNYVYQMCYDPGVRNTIDETIEKVEYLSSLESQGDYSIRMRKSWWASDYATNFSLGIQNYGYLDVSDPIDLYSRNYSAAMVFRKKQNKATLSLGTAGFGFASDGVAVFNKEGTKFYYWLGDNDVFTLGGGIFKREPGKKGFYSGDIEYSKKLSDRFSFGCEAEYSYYEGSSLSSPYFFWDTREYEMEKIEYMVSAVYKAGDWLDIGVKAGRNIDENALFSLSPYYIPNRSGLFTTYDHLYGNFGVDYLLNGYSGTVSLMNSDYDIQLIMNGYNLAAGFKSLMGTNTELTVDFEVFVLANSTMSTDFYDQLFDGNIYKLNAACRFFSGDNLILGISADSLIDAIKVTSVYYTGDSYEAEIESSRVNLSAGMLYYGKTFRVPVLIKKAIYDYGGGQRGSDYLSVTAGFESYVSDIFALRMSFEGSINRYEKNPMAIGIGFKFGKETSTADVGFILNSYDNWKMNSGTMISFKYAFE